MSYFGCSPASRAKLLATLSPREDVWPGRSARAPGLPLHRECGGGESAAPRAVILSLSAYCTRLSQALVGSVDPVCPGLTAPGALPLAQRLRLPPGAHYCGRAWSSAQRARSPSAAPRCRPRGSSRLGDFKSFSALFQGGEGGRRAPGWSSLPGAVRDRTLGGRPGTRGGSAGDPPRVRGGGGAKPPLPPGDGRTDGTDGRDYI